MSEQTNAITQKQPTGIAALKKMLDAPSVQAQFKNALAENKGPFIASVIDLYNGDKSLRECEPSAIVTECLKAAVMKLPISRALGFAYIVVYKNKKKITNPQTGRDEWIVVPTPTFIPGYKGYIQMAMRTGQYRTLNADVVYDGELRGFSKLSGAIDLTGEKKSDKIIGYFCHFELLNGFQKSLYMSVEDMAKYAKRYSPSVKRDTTVAQLIEKANNGVVGKSVGWEGNFNDMALKTCVRRLLSHYGYLSIEMMDAVQADTTAAQNETAARDEVLLEASASTKAIDLDASTVDFEEVVDESTGEVTTQAKTATEAPSQTVEAEADPY